LDVAGGAGVVDEVDPRVDVVDADAPVARDAAKPPGGIPAADVVRDTAQLVEPGHDRVRVRPGEVQAYDGAAHRLLDLGRGGRAGTSAGLRRRGRLLARRLRTERRRRVAVGHGRSAEHNG